ncbi:ARA1 [Candida jiufengensis]|uniref:ARA1 n=1 Tax=Candida jiufengensis TaxID=497108 RepID=UPI002223FBDC|nr:ARA1 [Candida jiufengensis]KAI5952882.1 ARA1 [Candida jiufengensis]
MGEVTDATKVRLDLNDGHKIPALGLGTVPSGDPSGVKDQVKTAINAGFRMIDTAWYYGTEKYVGEALKELFDEGVVKREDVFITTKVWPSYYHSPEKSLDESLQTLGLDYVDLLLQHWPIALSGDENGQPPAPKDNEGNLKYDDDPVNGTKFIEVYQNLEKILDNTTKTKSIGISNYSISRLNKLLPHVKHIPVINQIEYHPQLSKQRDLIELCEKNKIVVACYSGYGSEGAAVLKLPKIQELAKKYNVSTNEIANAYQILEGRVIIPRSSNLERIKSITGLPQLTKQELNELNQIGEENPKRYINDPWGYGIGFKGWEGDKLSEPL